MFSTLIVSQGGLARELVEIARQILAEPVRLEALSIEWTDDLETARRKVRQAIERHRGGDGVLVLVDIAGSTPSNAAVAAAEPGRVEVIAGVNLPMVLRLACGAVQTADVSAAAAWLLRKGQGSICRPERCSVPEAPCDDTDRDETNGGGGNAP